MKCSACDNLAEATCTFSVMNYHETPVQQIELQAMLMTKRGPGRLVAMAWNRNHYELSVVITLSFRTQFLRVGPEETLRVFREGPCGAGVCSLHGRDDGRTRYCDQHATAWQSVKGQ